MFVEDPVISSQEVLSSELGVQTTSQVLNLLYSQT